MTVAQTGSPNLSWIDEELRREKAIVEDLRNVIDKQQIVLVDQAQRILSLEDRLTRIQNQLQTLPEIRQASQNSRDEVVALMGDLRQDVQKREVEALRARQVERERDLRSLQEIRGELARFAPLEQAAAVSQAEDRRINETIMRLQGQIETLTKSLGQGDEGRRQLQDALAKSTVEIRQLSDLTADLSAVRPSLTGRILPLENEVSKIGQQVAELQGVRQELSAQQADLLEKQRRADRDRSQALTEWGRRIDAMGHQIEAWADQLRFFTDQHDKNRTVLRDVQALAHDLSQQQDRLRQLQVVTEEQLRQEQREIRVENDQRRAQDAERTEQTRVERATHDDAVDGRLVSVEQAVSDLAISSKGIDDRLKSLRESLAAQGAQSRQATSRALEIAQKDLANLVASLSEILGTEG
jgi:chromosome segregation ATPase